jgi:hypothetical protein
MKRKWAICGPMFLNSTRTAHQEVTIARGSGRERRTAPKGMCLMSYQRECSRESRPLPPSPSPQRHTESRCFYSRRGITPVKFRRDHGCLCLLARERLQHAHLFLRPRPVPSYLLRHLCSRASMSSTNSGTTITKIRNVARRSLPLALRHPNLWAPPARRRRWTMHCGRQSSAVPTFHFATLPGASERAST